jgi:uncharacterized protein
MEAREILRCRGHRYVAGTHRSTFEVTAETELTPAGDCIVGICSDKGAAGLTPAFKQVLTDDDALLLTRLVAGDICVEVRSRGSSAFTLDHQTDLVWRRSGFVCGRTVGIHSDFTARTLPRELIAYLQQGGEMTVELVAVSPHERVS